MVDDSMLCRNIYRTGEENVTNKRSEEEKERIRKEQKERRGSRIQNCPTSLVEFTSADFVYS
jgi:hypothetical protein